MPTFLVPTSINDPADATGLGMVSFHPYTRAHFTMPTSTYRGYWANPVQSLTRVGLAATVQSTAHGFSTGAHIEISGAADTSWNSTVANPFFTITVVDADHFTFNYPSFVSSQTAAAGIILARDVAKAYVVNDVVSVVSQTTGASGTTVPATIRYVCTANNTGVQPAFNVAGLASWRPVLNSGVPVYFPGHASYVQHAVPLMSQLQNDAEDLTQLAYPDISQEFLWWFAFGWAPGDSGNKHTIADYETSRSGTLGSRNVLQLRGPHLKYSFSWYGMQWGISNDFKITDQFGLQRLDWPIIPQFCIHDLDLDFNRSRVIEDDSRWAEPLRAKMRANVTSFREYAERGVTSAAARGAKYRIEQIETLDRLGQPLTIDPVWASTVAPGGFSLSYTQGELEILGSHTHDTGTHRGAWAVGTTYAVGERVTAPVTIVGSAVTTADFVSLQNGNIGRTPVYAGSLYWRLANSQLHIDHLFAYFSSTDHTARYPFKGTGSPGNATLTALTKTPTAEWVGLDVRGTGLSAQFTCHSTAGSPVLTTLGETPTSAWVGLTVSGGGLNGFNTFKILSIDAGAMTVTLDHPVDAGTGSNISRTYTLGWVFHILSVTSTTITLDRAVLGGVATVRDLTLPYNPITPTRQLEGRYVSGLRPDLLAIDAKSTVLLYESSTYIRKFDPVTRIADLASEDARTAFRGDLAPSTSGTPLVIQHLDTIPQDSWVGKILRAQAAGLSTSGNTTITAVNRTNPANYTITIDKPAAASVVATKTGFQFFVLTSDGPINAEFSNFGGFGLNYVSPSALMASARVGAVDPVARTITIFDPTPATADNPPYSFMTDPYFVTVNSMTMTAGSRVVTVNYPAWSSATSYALGDIVISGGTMWQAVATSTNVTPGTDGTKWVAYTLMTSEWLNGEIETWTDPIFGARPTVATVTAIGPNGGLGLAVNQFQASVNAAVPATAQQYAIRAATGLKQALDVVLPTQFPFKSNGMQLFRMDAPGMRPIVMSPRDPYRTGVTPFPIRGQLNPGSNIITHVEAHYGNGWKPYHQSAAPELWWKGADPAWVNVRGVSEPDGVVPWNAKITAVNLTDPLNVTFTIDKTMGDPVGAPYKGVWSAGTAYVTNDSVTYNGLLYKAIQNASGAAQSPTVAAYWAVMQGSPISIDDQPRTKITQRCRLHDSTCITDFGADTDAGGFEMSNGRNGIFYDAFTQLGDGTGNSVFFNWHSVQLRTCDLIEIDHIVNQWTWADTWNFGPHPFIDGSQHPFAADAQMQCEDISIHDVYCNGTGRQYLTVQGNAGLNFYNNTALHCQRLYADNESVGFAGNAHANLIGVRIATSLIDCSGSDIFMSVVPGFAFSPPPKKLTGVQLTNGSKVARIQAGSLTVTNQVNGDYQGATVDIWSGGLGTLPARTYFKKMLGWDAIELSAPYTGTDAVVELMLHDAALMRDWTTEDCTLTGGVMGGNFDSYISKSTIQQFSTVDVAVETTANSAIARIAGYAPRDDGTTITLDSTWIGKRINPAPSPAWNANTLITEIGPNGGDLPTAAHIRLSKVAKTDHQSPDFTRGLIGVVPCPWTDWNFLRNCSASTRLFAGDNGGQTGEPPMWTLGRFCDYVNVIGNILPAATGSNHYFIGWHDIVNPVFKYLSVDGPPTAYGFTHWVKSGNYFHGSPDNDFTPSVSLAAAVAFNGNPHDGTTDLTITVTLTPSDGQQVDGYIEIYLDTDPAQTTFPSPPPGVVNSWGVAPIVSNVATFTKASPASGIYYVTIRYNGGCIVKYPFLQQGPVTLGIDTAIPSTPTATALVAIPASSQPAGTATILSATITPNPGAADNVTFYDGATSLGTAQTNSSGVASIAVTAGFTAGTHSLTAAYAGDGTFQASTSAALIYTATNVSPPQITLQTPTPESTGVTPATSIQFAFDKPTQGLVFQLHRVSDNSLVPFTSSVGFGVYTITPTAALAQNAQYVASVVDITDQLSPATHIPGPITWQFTTGGTGLLLSISPNPGAPSPAAAPTFSAALTLPDGTTPAGTVSFFLNGLPFGSAQLPGVFPNRVTYQPGPMTAGTYVVTAKFGGSSSRQMWIQQSGGSGLLNQSMIDQMVAEGAKGIRIPMFLDSVYPTALSFSNDVPQYGSDGTLMQYAHDQGLEVLCCPLFDPQPKWSGGDERQVPTSGGGQDNWAEMMRRAYRDWGPGGANAVTAWELWNESNNNGFNSIVTMLGYRQTLRKSVLAMRTQAVFEGDTWDTPYIMNAGPSSGGSIPGQWVAKWDTGYTANSSFAGISQGTFLDGLFDASTGIVPGTAINTPYLSAYAIHAYTTTAPSPRYNGFENCLSHVGVRMPGIGDPAIFPNGFAFWDDILCVREGYPDPANPPPGFKPVWQTEGGLPSVGTYNGQTWTTFRQDQEMRQTWDFWFGYPFAGPYVYFHQRDHVGGIDNVDSWAGIYDSNNNPKPLRASFVEYAGSGGSTVGGVDSNPVTLTIGGASRYYGGKTTPG